MPAPEIITPTDIRLCAIGNRLHELRRMRRPDRPTTTKALARHRIVADRYLPPKGDGGPTGAPAAMAVRL